MLNFICKQKQSKERERMNIQGFLKIRADYICCQDNQDCFMGEGPQGQIKLLSNDETVMVVWLAELVIDWSNLKEWLGKAQKRVHYG